MRGVKSDRNIGQNTFFSASCGGDVTQLLTSKTKNKVSETL